LKSLPDVGASVSLALDERQLWELGKIWLPDAGASAPWTLGSASEMGCVSLRPK